MEQEQIVGVLLEVKTVQVGQDVAWIGRVTVGVEKSNLTQRLLKIKASGLGDWMWGGWRGRRQEA